MRKKLIKFRDDRNWTEFHTPERLSSALQIEAGELAKLTQWGKEPDILNLMDEIADVAIYLEYIAAHYDLEVKSCVKRKIEINAKKYPLGVDHVKAHGWEK